MKKNLGLLLVLIMVFSVVLTGCGGNDADVQGQNGEEKGSVQEIIDKGQIVLGTSADYPPFEFHALIDGEDKVVGFDIEIAKYIADDLGVELVIQEMDFDKLLGGLATGMLDMVIAGMNPDPDREANFSDIYYEAQLSVLVAKDNTEISTIEDLDGKSIGVQVGTVQEEIARNTIKDADVLALGTNPDLVMNLKTNKIDCIILETPVAESFAKVNEDIKVVENLLIDNESGGVAIAVKQGDDELTEKLNEILDDINSQNLIEKWFIEADELASDAL